MCGIPHLGNSADTYAEYVLTQFTKIFLMGAGIDKLVVAACQARVAQLSGKGRQLSVKGLFVRQGSPVVRKGSNCQGGS